MRAFSDRFGRVITKEYVPATPLDKNNHSKPEHWRYTVKAPSGEIERYIEHRPNRPHAPGAAMDAQVGKTLNNAVPDWWTEKK